MREPKHRNPLHARRGAMLPLMAVIMAVMLIIVGVTINTNWINLARTEAQSAADFAAMSALKAYTDNLALPNRRTLAKDVGADILNRNTVGGRTRSLSPDTIELGFLQDPAVHNPVFIQNSQKIAAAKVVAPRTGNDTKLPIFFAGLLGIANVDVSAEAVSAYEPMDLVLCLDASRSMTQDGIGWQTIHEPPRPESRWFKLTDTVDQFAQAVLRINPDCRLGLVTFGGGRQRKPHSPLNDTLARLEVPLQLASRFQDIVDVMDSYKNLPALGMGTSIYDGAEFSLDLLDNQSTPATEKVIILLSDGLQSKGVARPDPRLSADRAAIGDVTIHTINYKKSPNPSMIDMAAITGGDTFNATNKAGLENAFGEILKKFKLRLAD